MALEEIEREEVFFFFFSLCYCYDFCLVFMDIVLSGISADRLYTGQRTYTKARRRRRRIIFVCWLVGFLKSKQHASVLQGPICSDNCTCCHTEIEVADHIFHLTH